MTVRRDLDLFLGTPRPVDLLDSVRSSSGASMSIATLRHDVHTVASYGTTVELPAAPPSPGAPVEMTATSLGEDATRLRFHRGAQPIAPRVLSARDSPLAAEDDVRRAGVEVRHDTFTLSAAHGKLVSKPVAPEPLGRMARLDSTWPSHEQSWQVLHRHAYPIGTTADDGEPAWFASFELQPGEKIFGLGEDYGPLAKNGTTHHLWMQEAYSNTSQAVYKPVPFWWSTAGYGVLVNTTNPVRIDVGGRDHASISVTVDGADQLDLIVIEGDSPAQILATYTRLTSEPRVPPPWTFGVWMSRISYDSQEQVEAVASRMVELDIPCDVIHIDTNWFADDWNCDYRFCPDRFPDPQAMLDRLAAQGIRVCLWQWPNALASTSMYDECAAAGILALDTATGRPKLQDGFVGPAGVVDWSNPAARQWIDDKLRPLLDMGVAAIKTDFGDGAPVDAEYHSINGIEMHNAYPLLYNDAVMAVSESVHGDDAVVWSRSAWAGSQRSPIHWSGDGVAQWADLACVVRSMLSIGLSGIPFYAHDIGGFSGIPDADLYVRWTQLGVMSSHLRFHGFGEREPWSFGDETAAVVRALLHLRKQLQPHLIEQAEQSRSGVPLCRAMVLAYPDDPTCEAVDDQYQLGSDLLVAPILSRTGTRRVYIPSDDWLDWWTGESIAPGWHTVDHPLSTFPLWYRTTSQIVTP